MAPTSYPKKKAININPGDVIAVSTGAMVVRRVVRSGDWMDVSGRGLGSGASLMAAFPIDEKVTVLGRD